jgi:hypothetical protein
MCSAYFPHCFRNFPAFVPQFVRICAVAPLVFPQLSWFPYFFRNVPKCFCNLSVFVPQFSICPQLFCLFPAILVSAQRMCSAFFRNYLCFPHLFCNVPACFPQFVRMRFAILKCSAFVPQLLFFP